MTNAPLRTKAIETLRRLYTSEYSDFYRKKYAGNEAVQSLVAGMQSAELWPHVPFLTRDEILSASYESRLFIPENKVGILRLTSGTSGKGVLLMPRLNDGHDVAELNRSFFLAHTFKRLAAFSGAQFQYAHIFKKVYGLDSLQLDLADLSASARMFREYQPDLLGGFVYALEALAHELGGDPLVKNVRGLHLYGEKCSPLMWSELQKQFPNAIIFAEYSSIDAQTTIGFPCEEIVATGEQLVHPVPEFVYCEIIDPESGAVLTKEGEAGELVITVLRDVAFPLVRYRTGDVARIIRQVCACGRPTPVLSIEGRLETDKLRFSGGELVAAEIDRAFSTLGRFGVKDNYVLHYKEVSQAGAIKPQITARFEWDQSRIDAEKLAVILAEELRVAPQRVYTQLVEAGKCLPLLIEFTPRMHNQGKRVRIVRDE